MSALRGLLDDLKTRKGGLQVAGRLLRVGVLYIGLCVHARFCFFSPFLA